MLPLLTIAAAVATLNQSALLDRAANRLGLAELTRHGFVQLSFDSVIDNAANMQGVEGDPKLAAQESFAFDLAGDAFGWESRGDRGDGSIRWRRFAHPEPDVLLRIDFTEKWAGAIRSPAYRNERLRTARFLPHLIVREARQRMSTVRSLGPDAVSFATPAGEVIDLRFDRSGRLARSETLMAVPFLGDRVVAWEYSDWRDEPFDSAQGRRNVAIPGKIRIHIGDGVARELTLKSVQWSKSASKFFAIPADAQQLPERKGPDAFPVASLGGTAQKVADGVWFAHNVTPGTNAMFVEHEDGITVLEAPAGVHYPQTDIPLPNLVRGGASSGPGEALVDLIRRTVPGKPIRRIVISHPHADHAGGVRALAAEGAEILVADGAGAMVRRFLSESFLLEPDRFERIRSTAKPIVHEIADREIIGSGDRRIEVLRVHDNPHSNSMLAMWMPAPKIMFQGDLFYPDPLEEFPSPNRIPIMRWFAAWMERQKIEPERIYSTHGDIPATKEHLTRLRVPPASGRP